jgi:putative DNA primase/helicase
MRDNYDSIERGQAALDQESQSLQARAEATLNQWPSPDLLHSPKERALYPVRALPPIIGNAVREVQSATQAPVALVASSALATVSLGCQAHINVARDQFTPFPVSLFFIALAESGERKTTSDRFFTRSIREFEQTKNQEDAPKFKDYWSKLATWEAECKGLLSAIEAAKKSGKDTTDLKRQHDEITAQKPVKPLEARLIVSDITQEALVTHLAEKYPSIGMMSNEAGAVLGGHGFNSESVMKMAGTLNTIWDGQQVQSDRKGSGSVLVEGARLTASIQLQPGALQRFSKGNDDLARKIGMWTRFFFCEPESTQGERLYKEPPDTMPALDAFNARVLEILRKPLVFHHGSRALCPQVMTISPEAKTLWIKAYNEIELKLKGEFSTIKDFGSKAGENILRLAALFEYFETSRLVVSSESVKGAIEIVQWHLNEALRYFGTQDSESSDVVLLDDWIAKELKKRGADSIKKSELMRSCPNKLRKASALEAPLDELARMNRIRLAKRDDETVWIDRNPALLVN